ncbi:DNA topoisomerase 3 [Acetobacterium wieringae]|uniref:DNA topoisomerase n=1 Tax=Acetobacterium wieringae TaxID=52694 RepID=A0ABY6HIN0_9FIRM|nr:DNA topoisomerase 3 [Acetobacterium wieringae]UYO64400.1 DNA topoisomerase 3 [Acetobacterium wieringae]VUZ25226.1 DNA topoisomerase 3 [Acetobacterium wieringae]
MKLIVTEKPDVAKNIAKVLNINRKHDGWMEGNGYYLTWCVGHLVEMAQTNDYNAEYKKWKMSDLPITPENWVYKVSHSKEKQYKIVKMLMLDPKVDRLICATDAGREGELIFRLVYHHVKCDKPFDRLWISSMVEKSIKKGFDDLKDSKSKDLLYLAALCRAQADWLVGINGSRLFSLLYGGKLNVGRVQTPTLAIIVNREIQIKNFIKEKYYINHIDLEGLEAFGEKIKNEAQADIIFNATNGQDATIISVDNSIESVKAPDLYDLTTLQRDGNKYFGLTAAETLDATQQLYEKRLATYPRTDSQFITEDMKDSVNELLPLSSQFLGASLNHTPDISILINDKKVSDHHAILPTTEIKNVNTNCLSRNEQLVLNLIINRLILATAPRHQYSKTIVNADCSGYTFQAKGKTVVALGWKEYDSKFKKRMNITEKKKDEIVFPDIKSGQIFNSVTASISEHETSPPKRHNEDTLLSVMETAGNEFIEEGGEKKGIGTTATRASIIEKLISAEYIIRDKRQFIPTESGMSLIAAVPESIKSPKLTAEWENRLREIEAGKLTKSTFDEMIKLYIIGMVDENKVANESLSGKFKTHSKERESVGNCPRCGNPVYEGEKNFYCSNRECQFVLWKDNRFFSEKKKKITRKIAEDFLRDGKSKVTGLYSVKKDTKYDAVIIMVDTGGKYVNFKLLF